MMQARQVRILLVEDDEDDVYLVRRMLGGHLAADYLVAHCTCMDDCLRYLAQNSIDVVLLDLGLPDSQGLDTLQAIHSVLSDTPVIVFTGVNDDLVGQQAIQLGAEDFLPKAEVSSTLLTRAIAYAIERHRLMLQIRQQAVTDVVTGLPNRWALLDRLQILIEAAGRAPSTLALVMIDLDGFKYVNDTYGHEAGDRLLQEVARRLESDLRRTDMVARFGGDEFVLLLAHYHDHQALQALLERKLGKIGLPVGIGLQGKMADVAVGASFGVAQWTPGMSAKNLLAKADSAMYESKQNGKNRITFCEI